MAEFPTQTTTELLNALSNPAEQGLWRLFDRRYRPVITGFVMSTMGLNRDEAEEVAQAVLAKFTLGYRSGKFLRGKGRLRSWLMGIAQNTAIDTLRARGRNVNETIGDSIPAPLHDAWEREERAAISQEAWELLSQSGQLDTRTLRAFELTVLRDVPTDAAATQCEMSPESVYVAKTRVIKKLQKIEESLRVAYECDAS